jgi:Golgi nucleoside diphosphatase
MKKSVLLSISLILIVLIFVILTTGCTSPFIHFAKIEIRQMLDELGEANVEGNVDQIIIHYTDPITEVNHLSGETYVTSLEDKRIELEEMMTYVNCLVDDFSNEEITVLDTTNAIVECDEHAKFQDLFDEGVFYESIDRVKLTLVKVDGNWKISIYELLASEEVTQ